MGLGTKTTNFLLYIPRKIKKANDELIQGGSEGASYRQDIRNIRGTESSINEFEKNLLSQANAQEKLDTSKNKRDFIWTNLMLLRERDNLVYICVFYFLGCCIYFLQSCFFCFKEIFIFLVLDLLWIL